MSRLSLNKQIYRFLDFLGFHDVDRLKLNVAVDVTFPSMSTTTCLAVCASNLAQVAVVVGQRCICSTGRGPSKDH